MDDGKRALAQLEVDVSPLRATKGGVWGVDKPKLDGTQAGVWGSWALFFALVAHFFRFFYAS